MRLRQRHKIIEAGTGPIIASPDLYGPLLVETMLQLREASQAARCDRRHVSQRARFLKMQASAGIVDARIEYIQWHFQKTRSEEHTSELQSLMRISYAVFCLKNKT